MKYVGEARAKYNPSAPLIGVTMLSAIKGGEELWEFLDKNSGNFPHPALKADDQERCHSPPVHRALVDTNPCQRGVCCWWSSFVSGLLRLGK